MLFPGASLPFGMVKLSPDNTDETQYRLGAGYEYNINSITGFGHVHSWMMGSFVTMPATGELKVKPGTVDDPDAGYRSGIDNKNVEASAGYYSNLHRSFSARSFFSDVNGKYLDMCEKVRPGRPACKSNGQCIGRFRRCQP